VSQLNLQLFQWLAAGQAPSPWLLALARGFANGGAWADAAVLGWAAWRRHSHRTWLFAVLCATGIVSLLSHLIAARLDMPRPFTMGLSPAWIAHGNSPALPSTHAAAMCFAALALLLRGGLRDLGIVVSLIAAFTCWARIYVGVHFPVDIAAGFLLACVVLAAFELLQRGVRHVVMSRNPRNGSAWRAS
jgi:membrane-associated phospholipid phosphatase